MRWLRKDVNVYVSKLSTKEMLLRHKLRLRVEVKRFDEFLRSKGEKKTGWSTEKGFPDEKFFLKVLKFTDPKNLLGMFISESYLTQLEIQKSPTLDVR